jgi:hypothetical protein
VQEDFMDNWNELQAYANDRHKEMLEEARQYRLAKNTHAWGGSRGLLITFAVVLLSLITWWVR